MKYRSSHLLAEPRHLQLLYQVPGGEGISRVVEGIYKDEASGGGGIYKDEASGGGGIYKDEASSGG